MTGECIGRRVDSRADIEQPGDYCRVPVVVDGVTEDHVWFLLPNARDENARPGQRSINHVKAPPHVFRECADGSIEIRNSIGAQPFWHGFLDEGHVWREC